MTELRSLPSLRAAVAPPPSDAVWKERLCAAARQTPQSPSPGVLAWRLWSSASVRWAPACAFLLAVLWTGGLLGVLSMPEAQFLPTATLEAPQPETAAAADATPTLEEEFFTAGEDLLQYFENAVMEEESAADEFQDWGWYYVGF